MENRCTVDHPSSLPCEMVAEKTLFEHWSFLELGGLYQMRIANVFCGRNKKIIIKLVLWCARRGFRKPTSS